MLTWGVKRGLFSNESGQGSAPIAHAAAKTDEPIREGVVAMIGPFIDTLLICTMTGLVILISGVWQDKQEQQVLVNDQSAIEAHQLPGQVLSRSTVSSSRSTVWRRAALSFVRDGQPVDFTLVRNHALGRRRRVVHRRRPCAVAQPAAVLNGSFIELADEDGGEARGGSEILDRRREPCPMGRWSMLRGRAMQNGSPLTAWAFREGLGRVRLRKGPPAGDPGRLLLWAIDRDQLVVLR